MLSQFSHREMWAGLCSSFATVRALLISTAKTAVAAADDGGVEKAARISLAME